MAVDNETLLDDIVVTEKELRGYQHLSKGFALLSEIPENRDSGKAQEYRLKSDAYTIIAQECLQFMTKLQNLKVERGLL
jgi:hypothetical protein